MRQTAHYVRCPACTSWLTLDVAGGDPLGAEFDCDGCQARLRLVAAGKAEIA